MSQILIHQSNDIKFPYVSSKNQIPKSEEELPGIPDLSSTLDDFRITLPTLMGSKIEEINQKTTWKHICVTGDWADHLSLPSSVICVRLKRI